MVKKRNESSKSDNDSSSRTSRREETSTPKNVSSSPSQTPRVTRPSERITDRIKDTPGTTTSSSSNRRRPEETTPYWSTGSDEGSNRSRSLRAPTPAVQSDDMSLMRRVNSFDPSAPFPETMSGDMRLMRNANALAAQPPLPRQDPRSSSPLYAPRDFGPGGPLWQGTSGAPAPTIQDLVTGAHDSTTRPSTDPILDWLDQMGVDYKAVADTYRPMMEKYNALGDSILHSVLPGGVPSLAQLEDLFSAKPPTPAAQQSGIDWAGIDAALRAATGAQPSTAAAQQSGIDLGGILDALGVQSPTEAAQKYGIDWEGIGRELGLVPPEPTFDPVDDRRVLDRQNPLNQQWVYGRQYADQTPGYWAFPIEGLSSLVPGWRPSVADAAPVGDSAGLEEVIPERLTAEPGYSRVPLDLSGGTPGAAILTGEVDPNTGLRITRPIDLATLQEATTPGPGIAPDVAPIPATMSDSLRALLALQNQPTPVTPGSGGPEDDDEGKTEGADADADDTSFLDKSVDVGGKLFERTALGTILKTFFPDFWSESGRFLKGLDDGGSGSSETRAGGSSAESTDGGRGRRRSTYDDQGVWDWVGDRGSDDGDSRAVYVSPVTGVEGDYNHNGIPDYLEGKGVPQTPATTTTTLGPLGEAVFPRLPPYRPGFDNEWLYYPSIGPKKMAEGGLVDLVDMTADPEVNPAMGPRGMDPRALVIHEAELALRGAHPAPERALEQFIKLFGESALAELRKSVAVKMRRPRLIEGNGGGKDDLVPAMIDEVREAKLSNGEFVMTADAVKNAGDGDIDRGAQKLMELNDMLEGHKPSKVVNVEKVG